MALEFVQDAISLSGLTGSKLKSEIIGEYYPLWWNITSGGKNAKHPWATAIIELDAATGEIYIKDSNEIILGSAGHALDLKCNGGNKRNLKIVLVEQDVKCFSHLRKVISKRWPKVDIAEAEGPLQSNRSNIFLMNLELDEALSNIAQLHLGNSLFFFDPLRSVTYEIVERVAKARITSYYRTGTEFVIFVFTSDWFLGRDDFAALPDNTDSTSWSPEESKTVAEVDALFGDKDWRNLILNNKPIYERETKFIELYVDRLHKWFRYILPLPFNPKENQIYHLVMCSNFEIGIKATRGFYSKWTGNPKYSPDNATAFKRFRTLHPELFVGLSGRQKPPHWKMLWEAIKYHEDGICDYMCRDFMVIEDDGNRRQELLEWMEDKGYLIKYRIENIWKHPCKQYQLSWGTINSTLGIKPPAPLEPLSLRPLSLKEISQ
jgi:three-Cys-motif partner protein